MIMKMEFNNEFLKRFQDECYVDLAREIEDHLFSFKKLYETSNNFYNASITRKPGRDEREYTMEFVMNKKERICDCQG